MLPRIADFGLMAKRFVGKPGLADFGQRNRQNCVLLVLQAVPVELRNLGRLTRKRLHAERLAGQQSVKCFRKLRCTLHTRLKLLRLLFRHRRTCAPEETSGFQVIIGCLSRDCVESLQSGGIILEPPRGEAMGPCRLRSPLAAACTGNWQGAWPRHRHFRYNKTMPHGSAAPSARRQQARPPCFPIGCSADAGSSFLMNACNSLRRLSLAILSGKSRFGAPPSHEKRRIPGRSGRASAPRLRAIIPKLFGLRQIGRGLQQRLQLRGIDLGAVWSKIQLGARHSCHWARRHFFQQLRRSLPIFVRGLPHRFRNRQLCSDLLNIVGAGCADTIARKPSLVLACAAATSETLEQGQ